MKLSVAYILKNEAKNIIRSLESVKGIADEIVCVIDTATTDETYQRIADFAWSINEDKIHRGLENDGRQIGKFKIYFNKFKDFASQRNYGLSKCTGDWILILDADETVSEKACNGIRKLMEMDFDIWAMFQIDRDGQMCHTFRLIKNGIQYIKGDGNKIHETLDTTGYKVNHSDVIIDHHKNLTSEEHTAKIAWILETIAGIPESVKKDYYEGIYFIHTGEHKKGIDALNRCINGVSVNLKAFIHLVVAKHYKNIAKMYELEFLHNLNKSLEIAPNQNEGHIVLGDYYAEHNELNKAKECLNQLAGLKTQMQNDKFYNEEQIKLKGAQYQTWLR